MNPEDPVVEDFDSGNERLRVEDRVRQAGDFIVPSETLRGRILEEALRQHRGEGFDRMLMRLGFALLLASLSVVLAFRSGDSRWQERYRPVTSEVLLERAEALSGDSHMQEAEALAMAYDEWRMNLRSNGWGSQSSHRGNSARTQSSSRE
jgi:hypothetical protein